MSQGAPLFVTGTARSGTTLLCYMLNANRQVLTAIDPYLPLFRSFRNATIRQFGDMSMKSEFDPNSAFSDYYFDVDHLRILDTIQDGALDIPFDPSEWDSFYKSSMSRMQIECGYLAPYASQLQGNNYHEIFDN